ncbi:odorant receptor 85b-like [Ceratitis capitata]|uniref:odorant receptor 85b-like n=1 Tax=Ceratitis capitata TaxID=7213 RepID=UPI000A0FC78F|nr:odorant receptor 85b-like [Ceratitis capitata]
MHRLLCKFEQVAMRVFPSDVRRGQIGSIEFNIWLSQMTGVPLPPSFVPLRRRFRQIFDRAEVENKLFLVIYATVIGFTGFTAMILVFINPDMAGKIFPYRVALPAWLPLPVRVAYIGTTDFMFAVQIVTVDYLNIGMMNLLRCHLNVMKSSFDELNFNVKCMKSDIKRIRDPNERLADIVRHHCVLKSVRDDVEQIFRLPVLLQFFTSLVISAVTGFQATIYSSNFKSELIIYFYCFCIFTQLFGYCWFGNEVNEQNKTLAARGYSSSWYYFDNRFRKSLAIFLVNAQQPFDFTGGGFVALSLPSFTGIMSKAYSFIAVLRQMYDR